jgi:uracil-DNA glycosylase
LPQKLTPETDQAVRARIAYFRDLGVFDFYRRDWASGAILADSDDIAEPEANVADLAAVAELSEMPLMPKAPLLPIAEERKKIAPQDKAAALAAIREDIGPCTRCDLSKGRKTIVFGDGDPNARLMFVGEGPGADEDAQGLPFVGRAGQLLNNMIAAMGLRRDQVYIANIVKCRPPQNRVPEPAEAHTCVPFLYRQIDVIQPEVIVALGSTAATYLLGAKSPLSALRGRVHPARGAKLIVTYHPAFLLRDPRQKKEAWADLQITMAELGLPKQAKSV